MSYFINSIKIGIKLASIIGYIGGQSKCKIYKLKMKKFNFNQQIEFSEFQLLHNVFKINPMYLLRLIKFVIQIIRIIFISIVLQKLLV